LTLGDGGKMKLDTNPFTVSMDELMDKKVLVHMVLAETTKSKNMVVSDELHNWMIKPHNPEIGVWKENMLRKPAKRVKPTSAIQQLEEDRMYWVTQGIKQDRFFKARNRLDQWGS
jgi:cytidylate kinase